MQLRALFFCRRLQDAVLKDLEVDIQRFKDVRPGLMGKNFERPVAPQPPISINGFFPGSEPNDADCPRKLCDAIMLDCVKDGPHWARIWIMLVLLFVSPRLASSVMSEPGALGARQRVWINGKTTGFRLDPFMTRMHLMMCGDANDMNAMTPIEIVVREIDNFRSVVESNI